jgi:hypothetical protein
MRNSAVPFAIPQHNNNSCSVAPHGFRLSYNVLHGVALMLLCVPLQASEQVSCCVLATARLS